MTDAGFFIMARGWMDHPALQGRKNAPLSKREAWCWMIEQAAWQTRAGTAMGKTVTIARGQLCYSYRFLATAWGWNLGAVQRWLDRLKTDTMITVSTMAGQLLITICNYDKYQIPLRIAVDDVEVGPDTLPIQKRYGADTNKNKGNKGKKEDIGAIAPLVGFGADAFEVFWSEYPEKVGKGAARKAFDRALKKASLPDILAGVTRYRQSKPADRAWAHPATWLNQERWLDQPAQGDLLRDPPPATGVNGHGHDEAGSRDRAELIARVRQRIADQSVGYVGDGAGGDVDPVLPPDARRH